MEPPCAKESFRPFLRNSALLLGIELASKVLGLAFFIIMARYLGAGELGAYAFAMALANFFAIAPRFGFDKMVQREIGRRGVLPRSYFIELTVVKAVITVPAMGLLFLVLWFASPKLAGPGMVISCFVFGYAYLEFLNAVFRGLQRAEFEVVSRSVFSILNLCLSVAVLWHGGRLMGVALAQAASVSVAILTAFILLKRFTVESRPDYGFERLFGHLRMAAPLGGVLVALYFSNQAGVLVLGAMAGETEAGYFSASMRVFDNLTLIAAALMGAFLPRASELYQRSREDFSQTSELVMGQVLILAIPMGIGLAVLAEPIVLLLYGATFAPSVTGMRVLGVTLVFSYWNYVADSILIAADKERVLFRVTCATAAVHVASNLALVHLHSHVGAALAVTVTQVFNSMLLTYSLRGTVDFKGHGVLIWKTAICAFIMGALLHVLRDLHVLVLIPLGAGVYLAGLLLTGTVDVREWRSLGASSFGKVFEK